MIFLTGHRASGKTTVGNLLASYSFYLSDVGPFWRKLRDEESPSIDLLDFFKKKRIDFNDPRWEDTILANHLREIYPSIGGQYQDVVVSGYRSPESMDHVIRLSRKQVFPERRITVIYIDTPFDRMLERYIKRDKNTSELDLIRQYEWEKSVGLELIKDRADFILDNSRDKQYLESQVTRITFDTLGYSKEVRR